MEDDIAKHGKKIFDTMKSSKHTFREKAKEIIIEIAIIVFAVSVSIWFHNWSEDRKEQQGAQEFLSGLKTDLEQDAKLLQTHINIVNRLNAHYNFFLSIDIKKAKNIPDDSVISSHFLFEIPVTRPNIGRYDGFKSSGKIESIQNNTLKEDILIYYEQIIPDLVYGENYVNSVQLKFMDLAIDRPDQTALIDFITTRKIRSLLMLGKNNFEVNLRAYHEALKKARKIIATIEKEEK